MKLQRILALTVIVTLSIMLNASLGVAATILINNIDDPGQD